MLISLPQHKEKCSKNIWGNEDGHALPELFYIALEVVLLNPRFSVIVYQLLI